MKRKEEVKMTGKRQYGFEDGLVELRRLAIESEKPVLFVFAGGSCSGKTYLTDVFRREVSENGWPVSVAGMDHYFKDITDPTLPRTSTGGHVFDAPESLHLTDYVRDVLCLLKGEEIYMPVYNVSANMRVSGEYKTISPAPIIVAEGLFVISALDGKYSNIVKVYLEADEEIRLQRKISRDAIRYGISREKIEKYFRGRVLHYHAQYVVLQKARADMILQT